MAQNYNKLYIYVLNVVKIRTGIKYISVYIYIGYDIYLYINSSV